eukprot:COSAG03_NODE_21497_length_303_cov_0.995098_1_plen_41_part_01
MCEGYVGHLAARGRGYEVRAAACWYLGATSSTWYSALLYLS